MSKCHTSKYYWLSTIQKWTCSECGARHSLKAGTLMEKTHIPLLIWFVVIHLMTSTKKAFSALEIQRQTGFKFYEPIWYMMQKICVTMGKRDAKYKLQGNIEIDDAFFEVVNVSKSDLFGHDFLKEHEVQKRGRGSTKQAKVLVMVESKPNPLQDNPHKKDRILGFAKMIAMDDLSSEGINYEVKKSISPTSIVISDGYKGFNGLKDIIEQHNAMVVPQSEAHIKLPWVHTVIANAKRGFLGTHHSIGRPFYKTISMNFLTN
jgi:hypothetical protein